MRTLKDLDDAGVDLRLWCYRCERATTIHSCVWMAFEVKGWSIEVGEARKRFRCRCCGSRDDVLLVGATRMPEEEISWKLEVERFFHTQRAERKKRGR